LTHQTPVRLLNHTSKQPIHLGL